MKRLDTIMERNEKVELGRKAGGLYEVYNERKCRFKA